MKRVNIAALVLSLAVASAPSRVPAQGLQSKLAYPPTLRGDAVDERTKSLAPYRWLEDLDAPEVARWAAAQNAVTEQYLAALPLRRTLHARLTTLWNFSRVGLPSVTGGQLFYTRNSGLQRQSPLYMRASPTSAPTLVIDPNAISPDGKTSLAQYTPSPDARLLAYALAEGGADWRTVKVRDIATGKDLDDEIRWMRFSGISWTNDAKGFYYSRFPEPPKNKALEAALTGQALSLPPRRHAAVSGPADLRAQRPAALADRRRCHRGWAVSRHRNGAGLRQSEPRVLRRSRRSRTAERPGDRETGHRGGRCRVCAYRQPGFGAVSSQRPRCAESQGSRCRRRQSCDIAVEDDRPRAKGADRGRRRDRRARRSAVPR